MRWNKHLIGCRLLRFGSRPNRSLLAEFSLFVPPDGPPYHQGTNGACVQIAAETLNGSDYRGATLRVNATSGQGQVRRRALSARARSSAGARRSALPIRPLEAAGLPCRGRVDDATKRVAEIGHATRCSSRGGGQQYASTLLSFLPL